RHTSPRSSPDRLSRPATKVRTDSASQGGMDMQTGTLLAIVARLSLAAAAAVLGPALALAQDVAITNARIVVGNGEVIDSGTIVVRGGRIAEVTAGRASARGLRTIDARGMTAMPGFIDAHRHINTGPNEREEMQAQLEAGYTTILSGGGPADGNLVLRDRIER